jgi:hypothetical protein
VGVFVSYLPLIVTMYKSFRRSVEKSLRAKNIGGEITPHATIVRLHEHDNLRQTSNGISYNIHQKCTILYSESLSTVILEAPPQLVSLTLHLLLLCSSARRTTIAAGGAFFPPADEKYGRSPWKVKSMQHLQTAQNRG